MRKILILVESILIVVVLVAITILFAEIDLPEWGAAVLTVVPLFALLLFLAILVLYKDPATYNQRGLARARKGDQAGAIAAFTRAIELNPSFAEAYHNRGFVRREGDLAGAIADYDRAIELDPANVAVYVNRGVLLDEQGNRADAIADYSRAIELDPASVAAYVNRGVVQVEQGYLDGAIADFDRAIALDPRNVPAYIGRGRARALKGDRAGAIADYDEASRLSPTDPEKAWVYACRALAYAAMGDAPAACESLAAAIALDPHWRDTARADPVFDPIRREPCFQALIALI